MTDTAAPDASPSPDTTSGPRVRPTSAPAGGAAIHKPVRAALMTPVGGIVDRASVEELARRRMILIGKQAAAEGRRLALGAATTQEGRPIPKAAAEEPHEAGGQSPSTRQRAPEPPPKRTFCRKCEGAVLSGQKFWHIRTRRTPRGYILCERCFTRQEAPTVDVRLKVKR